VEAERQALTSFLSQSLELGPAVLTIWLHHARKRLIQRPVCDDRRGGDSCSCSRHRAVKDGRLVRVLEPADDLTEGGTHALKRVPNSRVD